MANTPRKPSSKRAPTRKGAKAPIKPKRGFLSWLWGFVLKLSLVGMVLGACGLAYLDAQVREKFEGKKWAIPAKVYARPLELYTGLPLARDELVHELKALGYRAVRRASSPGTMEVASNRVRFYTRGFAFPDAQEPSQSVLVSFSGSKQNTKVSAISNIVNKPLSLTRLEPVLIGGIYPKDNEDRELIRIENAPNHLADALVVVEDRQFYNHYGVSLKGIARAMVANLRAGRVTQGGSTLTQQLVKNFYLTSERSMARKLMELPMAVLLELHYSKDAILEAYLNEVYLGQSGSRAIHGFGLASQYYFAQPLSELGLHQVALLVGMVKGPSLYDPRRRPEKAKERRDLVLKLLADAGKITEQQKVAAQKMSLGVVKKQGLQNGAYPAFLDLVKRQLKREYPADLLSEEGLKVYTSLDPLVQYRAEQAVKTTLTALTKRHGSKAKNLQAGMVVTDPQTAEVIAVVGSAQTRYQGFNRALDAKRPIGSLVKPAVFLSALESGYTLGSLINDSPFKVKMPDGQMWAPQNFDKKSHGKVPLHWSLSQSYNLSTAQLGIQVGLGKVMDTLERLGVTQEVKPYPSLLLGAESMSPYQIAMMYQTFAANGFRTPIRAIREVTSTEGNALSRYPLAVEQTVRPEHIHLIQYALQEVVREGTAKSAYSRISSRINLAGKTGTSNDQRDSWFAGFAGNRLAAVWVGKDNNDQLPFTGSSGALRVWTDFMVRETPTSFEPLFPDNVEYVWIDASTGLRSSDACPESRQLPYIVGTAPEDYIPCAKPSGVERAKSWFKGWF